MEAQRLGLSRPGNSPPCPRPAGRGSWFSALRNRFTYAHESTGREFPAQLDARLRQAGDYEVINAAMPGMTVQSMIPYWQRPASFARTWC